MASGFIVEDNFSEAAKMLVDLYPKEVKSFLRREGTKLKNRTVKVSRTAVKKHKGNYEKGIKRGKYYKFSETGADSIRVYAGSPAYHAHLIEYGHRIVTRGKRDTGEIVEGKRVFNKAAADYESTYERNCEKFADKLMSELD